ncbi:serine protease [Evansella caseinilytica]|uniref:Serine protease n=1 Tax=Evansella caseinilytica TaxID=1503961 RepID=A0A1H3G915_9BACI|nr:S8 family serine peptidase [Evansella caseinilytica]SDX99537.1 serine protease [Evansella caseinilytica]
MKKLLVLFFTVITFSGCSSSINDKEYYFNFMDLERLWEYSEGESQIIAFIDTGISEQAKALYSDRIIDTYNSIEDSKNVVDNHGHGTQIISISSGNGEKGIWGIAPKAKVIVIKALGDEGEVEDPTSIVKAIDYAISKEVDIINMSFGSFVSNSDIENQIQLAIKNNSFFAD